jgi:hypothetical protein
MKNTLGFCVIIGLAFLLDSCASSGSSQMSKSGPQPLIQNSDFAIVTQRLDTLYLCSDERMSFYLKECWDRGDFKPARKPVINIVNCDDFEKLLPRISGGRMSQASN